MRSNSRPGQSDDKDVAFQIARNAVWRCTLAATHDVVLLVDMRTATTITGVVLPPRTEFPICLYESRRSLRPITRSRSFPLLSFCLLPWSTMHSTMMPRYGTQCACSKELVSTTLHKGLSDLAESATASTQRLALARHELTSSCTHILHFESKCNPYRLPRPQEPRLVVPRPDNAALFKLPSQARKEKKKSTRFSSSSVTKFFSSVGDHC
jgi:hypothetical protein